MTNDNAASRLLAILQQGKALNGTKPTKDAWMSILDVDKNQPNYEIELTAKLGKVMLLPHEINVLLSQYYPTQVVCLRPAQYQIQNAFTKQELSRTWNTFIDNIDSNCINSLSLASALLDVKLNTKLIDDEKLAEFKVTVSELLNEVITSSLDDEFKRFMAHHLQKILDSINYYYISGAMPILDAAESTIGHAVINPKFREEMKNTDVGCKIFKFISVLSDVTTVATAAQGAIAHISGKGIPFFS